MNKVDNMEEVFKLFKIPYKEIAKRDREMIELLFIFNVLLDIKTKYCCFGHKDEVIDSYVMFSDDTEDSKIIDLAKFLSQKEKVWNVSKVRKQIVFNRSLRWVNSNGEKIFFDNWKLDIHYCRRKITKNYKKKVIRELKRQLYEYVEFQHNKYGSKV